MSDTVNKIDVNNIGGQEENKTSLPLSNNIKEHFHNNI